ncbi:MAG: hypothetical protein Q4Q20_06025, partial [Methanocorpusculum sp.]|nr:hypothetical protein [Methanocorpusculum sp.]
IVYTILTDISAAMKKLCIAAIVLLLTAAVILSAGCVSLGSTTTEIFMGDEKIGTITLTPAQHAASIGNTPLERYDIEVELFGLKYTKGGLTDVEAIVSLSNLTREGITIEGIQDALKDFTLAGAAKGESSVSLLDTLLHMPISTPYPVDFGMPFNTPDAGDAINEAMDNLGDMLNSISLSAPSGI